MAGKFSFSENEKFGGSDNGNSIEIDGGDGEIGIVDPISIVTSDRGSDGGSYGNNGGAGRKPRSDKGKKRGPRNKAEVQAYISSLGSVLYLIHSTLSEVTRTPELELSEDEAKNVAKAAEELASQYEIVASEKQKAWFQFLTVCGAVYGTRAIAIAKRKSNEKKQKDVQNTENKVDVFHWAV